jgi:hypothetical protein
VQVYVSRGLLDLLPNLAVVEVQNQGIGEILDAEDARRDMPWFGRRGGSSGSGGLISRI